jgi:hypothetical protein
MIYKRQLLVYRALFGLAWMVLTSDHKLTLLKLWFTSRYHPQMFRFPDTRHVQGLNMLSVWKHEHLRMVSRREPNLQLCP